MGAHGPVGLTTRASANRAIFRSKVNTGKAFVRAAPARIIGRGVLRFKVEKHERFLTREELAGSAKRSGRHPPNVWPPPMRRRLSVSSC